MNRNMSTEKLIMNGVNGHGPKGEGQTATHPEEPQQKADPAQGLLAAFAYGGCSVGMAFANKALLTSYHFKYQFTLIFAQMVFTAVVLEVLRRLDKVTLPAYTLRRGYNFIMPSLFYAGHSVLSLSALTGMNIPMYGVLKRCAPITTLFLGTVVLGKGLPSMRTCVAIVLITVGCFIAGNYISLVFLLLLHQF